MILPFEHTSMVWAITGTLGSGKSLVSVAAVVEMLSKGNVFVCTNIRLDDKAVSRYCGYDVKPYIKYIDLMAPDFNASELPCGTPRGYRGKSLRVIVMLDECAEFFDQYSSARDPRIQDFLSWLRHCSKRSQDVLLIVQNREFLNKSLRNLCARFVVCHNLSNIRLPVLHIRFLPRVSVSVVFDRYGNRGGLPATFLRQRFWGQFYDTAQEISTSLAFRPPTLAKTHTNSYSTLRPYIFIVLVIANIYLYFSTYS